MIPGAAYAFIPERYHVGGVSCVCHSIFLHTFGKTYRLVGHFHRDTGVVLDITCSELEKLNEITNHMYHRLSTAVTRVGK